MLKRRVTFYQSGFTLIEVLVAIIILAIGLLGLANLQTVSLRNNQSAYLRTQAVWLANDIADRMRSNMQFDSNQVLIDIYNNVNPTQSNCSNNNPCTPQQIAANDLCEWNIAINKLLPHSYSGKISECGGVINGLTTYWGTICIDSNPNDSLECDGLVISGVITYVVRIQWNDPTQPNAPQVFRMSFQIA
jgi:type IV pilus assembly protein PilV